jgi:hypothetical protein
MSEKVMNFFVRGPALWLCVFSPVDISCSQHHFCYHCPTHSLQVSFLISANQNFTIHFIKFVVGRHVKRWNYSFNDPVYTI